MQVGLLLFGLQSDGLSRDCHGLKFGTNNVGSRDNKPPRSNAFGFGWLFIFSDLAYFCRLLTLRFVPFYNLNQTETGFD